MDKDLKSKKEVGRKKSKSEKTIQYVEKEEKRLRTSKGKESTSINKDSRTL